jgi:hypothetical protein
MLGGVGHAYGVRARSICKLCVGSIQGHAWLQIKAGDGRSLRREAMDGPRGAAHLSRAQQSRQCHVTGNASHRLRHHRPCGARVRSGPSITWRPLHLSLCSTTGSPEERGNLSVWISFSLHRHHPRRYSNLGRRFYHCVPS